MRLLLSRYRAEREAPYQVTSHGEADDHHREHDDGADGRKLAPVQACLGVELGRGDWEGLAVGSGEGRREGVVVLGEDQAEYGRRHDAGCDQGQGDTVEGLEA